MSWPIRSLTEVAPINSRKPELFDGVRRYYSTGAVGKNGELGTPELVTFAERPSRANSMPKVGDVGFARMNGTQKVVLVGETELGALFSTGFCFLAPNSALVPKYLFYFLTSEGFQGAKDLLAGEGIMGGIKNSDIPSIQIPLPPLLEQQRIVQLLDEAFEGIAIAKTNAEKNLLNSKALFEQHLETVFIQAGERWSVTTLETVLVHQPKNGWSPPAANHAESGVPVLTLSSVTGFEFQPNKVKYTSAPTDDKKSYWVKNGDLLMTRSNTPDLVGHVAIAAQLTKPTIFPDLIMRMNPDPNQMLTEFLYFQLRTATLRKEITGQAKGANPTMVKISNDVVRSLSICVPATAIQKKIVELLIVLLSDTQHLERLFEQKLTLLKALSSSLLSEAFSGNLKAA